jgi:hypothetical protein
MVELTGQTEMAALDDAELARELTHQLAGAPSGSTGPEAIVWAAQGSEVVLHLDSLAVELTPGHLRVRIDCETNETGRVNQEIHLALADPSEAPNFCATTGLVPHGDPRLANRWAPRLADAVWATVIRLAGPDAQGVAADHGALIVHRNEPTAPTPLAAG